MAEGGQVVRTQLGRIAGVDMGDPDPGIWTLSSLVATATVHAQASLAPLLGHLRSWPSFSSVTSLPFGWVLFPQSWVLAWPSGQDSARRRPQGQTVGVTLSSLSPPLASQGSPEPQLRPRLALSLRGTALRGLFLDMPVSRPLHPHALGTRLSEDQ